MTSSAQGNYTTVMATGSVMCCFIGKTLKLTTEVKGIQSERRNGVLCASITVPDKCCFHTGDAHGQL